MRIATLAGIALLSTLSAHASGDPARTPGLVTAAASADALDPDTLARMVAGARQSLDAPPPLPPPPTITTRRGRLETIPIAAHHLNRFRTGFRALRIETTSEAVIRTEGGTFYVATDAPEPVSMFVIDRDNADNSLALLLRPSELPPADVELATPWATLRPPLHDAPGGDADLPHVDALKRLFRALAQGRVPPGYGIEPLPGGSALMPHCDAAGLRIEPAQLLTGGALVALVARVSNPTREDIELDESACAAPDVLAVAAWPLTSLAPGDETELYIAVRRPESPAATTRPLVLTRTAR
jgi:conjugal transfer pilus assembly protein TraK